MSAVAGVAPTSGLAVAHLALDQVCLDVERVLALVRTRGYHLQRLIVSGDDCHLWIEASEEELPLLCARLRRLQGPRLCGDLEWRA